MTVSPKILVTGATGFVGSYVVREFLQHGYHVVGLHRKSSDLTALHERISEVPSEVTGDVSDRFTPAVGDICDIDSLRRASEGVDGIIHIAALFREAKHPDEVFTQVNVGGTSNVLQVAKERGVKVVHCSTVGVHSHIPNPPATEEEEYRPGDVYQESKCEGEKFALQKFRSGEVNGVVIRPAMIWGPGDTRTLKLYKGIAERRYPFIGWGNTHHHWISVIDLATSFRLAFEKDVPSGEIYIISGRRAVPVEELFSLIAKESGVAPPRLRIPALPVQLLGSLCEVIYKPFGIEPPIYRRRVDFFTKTRWFNSAKANRELGFEPRGDIVDEIRENLEWYWRSGWIARPSGMTWQKTQATDNPSLSASPKLSASPERQKACNGNA